MSIQQASLIKRINELPNRKFREISYLLSTNDIETDLIPLQLRYPTFGFEKQGKLKLDLEEPIMKLLNDDLSSLSDQTALGRYAERLLAIWFKHNPHYDLLKFNHQIVVNKRTLGEIDYLLLEKESSNAIQLEFAIKYFLAIEQNEQVYFIGPKGKDSLEAKSKKLTEQQMQMSLNHSDQLDEEIRDLDFRPQIMLKGELFYPFDPENSGNLWLHLKDIDQLIPWGEGSEFITLTKRRDWLFPFDIELWNDPLSLNDCVMEIRSLHSQIPLMIAYKMKSGDYGRLMIVADSWPKPL